MTTTTQPTLWPAGPAPEVRPIARGGTIQERFEAFHRANDWVYAALERLTADMVSRGRRRIGMKALFEVLRWEWAKAATDPASEFVLNNNYTSRYARLLVERNPRFAGVFEMRKVRAA